MATKCHRRWAPVEYQVLSKIVLGPDTGRQWLDTLEHYLLHKGPEWTSARVKALYTMSLILCDSFTGDVHDLSNWVWACAHNTWSGSLKWLPAPLNSNYLHKFYEPEEIAGYRRMADLCFDFRKRVKHHYTSFERSWSSRDVKRYTDVAKDSRIRLSQGLPLGVEGRILSQLILTKRPHRKMQILSILRGYQLFKLKRMSPKQIAKAQDSICTPYLGEELFLTNDGIMCNGSIVISCEVIKKVRRLAEATPLKQVSLDALHGSSSYYCDDPSRSKLNWLSIKDKPFGSLLRSWFTSPYFPDSLAKASVGFSYQETHGEKAGTITEKEYPDFLAVDCDPGQEFLGKIHLIQEPGCKGRVICLSSSKIQFLLKPWHDRLDHMIRMWDGDVVSSLHDQTKGLYTVLNGKAHGNKFSCVDLSSATDRFPLKLQTILLRSIGMGPLADALEDLRGPYRGLDGQPWYYESGQPMGLYSSFPLFHLTHMCLAETLIKRLGGQASILGDDIVLTENLSEHYVRVLQNLGVKVAAEKCFSKALIEFAGYLVLGNYAGKPIRWPGNNNPNPMTVMARFTTRSMRVSKRYEKAWPTFRKTLKDRDYGLSPWLPTSEDVSWTRKDVSAGSPYFGSLLNAVTMFSEATQSDEALLQAYSEERFALQKEYESIMDMGKAGVARQSNFDPKRYLISDRLQRQVTLRGWSVFDKDPLVRTARALDDQA